MFYIGCNHLGSVTDTPPKLLELLQTVDLVIIEYEDRFLSDIEALKISVPNYVLFDRSHEFADSTIEMLRSGKNVLLLVEMGYPGTADPGSDLIRRIGDTELEMGIVTGPSIGPMAIAMSGHSSTMYTVVEFFEKNNEYIKDKLNLLNIKDNLIVALHHKEKIIDVLRNAELIMPDRFVCLCINLGWSKHQKILRGYIKDIIDILDNNTIEDVYGPLEIRPVATLVFI